MVGDPRDRTAYRIAFVGLGLALAILLIGISWISTEGESKSEWTVGRGHGCASQNTKKAKDLKKTERCKPPVTVAHTTTPNQIPTGLWISLIALGGVLVGALIPFPLPRSTSTAHTVCLVLALLLFLLAGIAVVGSESKSFTDYAVVAVLLGLLIPSPAREE